VRKIVITDPFSGQPYMTRRILLKTRWLSIYLHRFWRGDHDRALHNHPWRWAASFIVRGSYVEQRLGKKPRAVRWFNWITSRSYHRIAELRGEVWSIFIGGPKAQDWGFLFKGRHVPHEQYFQMVRGEAAA
jgi:hypothetical protein